MKSRKNFGDTKLVDYLLYLAVIMLLLCSVWRLSRILPKHTLIEHPSGSQVALAQDLAEGVFYRPLMSELGYGGTRYMPGHFALLALLIKLTGNALWSGYFLSLASGVGLMAGIYYLLRNLSCGVKHSILCSMFVFTAGQFQYAIATIRADLTAAMLSIWGLAFFVSAYRKEKGVMYWLAGLFFVLALVTKMTNVFCFAGACAFLFLKGKKLQSIIFFFATVATMLICVLVLNYLSQGRMIEAMKYCSTGGAVFWKGPVKMFKNIVAYDTSGLMVIISAIAAIMFLNLRKLTGILALTFIISGVATVMMFLSPGVDINHLLDLEVIAIILLASFAAEQTMPRKFILSILTVITVFASISTMAFWRNDEQSPARKEGLEAVELLKKRNHPLLIEDTALSVIAGQRPFLLDPFSLRLARMNNEEFDRDFIGKIRQQFFGAIILMGNPDTFRWWLGPMYETTHFGHGFTDVLKEYYIRDPRFSKSYIYIPRKFPEE